MTILVETSGLRYSQFLAGDRESGQISPIRSSFANFLPSDTRAGSETAVGLTGTNSPSGRITSSTDTGGLEASRPNPLDPEIGALVNSSAGSGSLGTDTSAGGVKDAFGWRPLPTEAGPNVTDIAGARPLPTEIGPDIADAGDKKPLPPEIGAAPGSHSIVKSLQGYSADSLAPGNAAALYRSAMLADQQHILRDAGV
jgi:hypothetical protein